MRTHQNLPPDAPEPAQSRSEPNLAHPFNPTPEPWSVHPDPVGFRVYKTYPDPGPGRGFTIADFPRYSTSITPEVVSDTEVLSNMRLFLAAPRMLTLLRRVADPFTNEMTTREEAQQFLRELEGGVR